MNRWFQKNMKFVFLAPSIIFIVAMIIAPLVYNFSLSFTDWTMAVNKAHVANLSPTAAAMSPE